MSTAENGLKINLTKWLCTENIKIRNYKKKELKVISSKKNNK